MNVDPAEMLRAYVEAFETQHVAAVTAFYQLPCTFVRPDGTWIVSDAATAVALVTHLIDHARNQGYRRTETRDLEVKWLAANLAAMTGVFVRYDASDDAIGQFGFMYIVQRHGSAWRIVVAVAHDASPPAA